MSYTVKFGYTNKRINSTKQTYTEAVSATCVLKDECDIHAPTFALHLSGEFPVTCNYMYVSEWNRYYWITSAKFYHGTWEVSGKCDVMASFKTDIGTTQAYILRSASMYDSQLIDNKLSFQATPAIGHEVQSLGLDATGIVLVTVVGTNADDSDSSAYWAMTPSNWARLYCNLYKSQFLQDIKTNVWDAFAVDFVNLLISPGDYISNAIWLPVPYANVPGTEVTVTIAKCQTSAQGKHILPNQLLLYNSGSITLPNHPQEAAYGPWLRGNAASSDYVVLPGYGTINLDSDAIAAAAVRALQYSWAVDCSGALTYQLNTNGKVYVATCNIGTPVGFADNRADIGTAVSSTLSAAAAGMNGNYLGMLGAVGNAALSMFPQVERVSSGGSRALPYVQPNIETVSTFYKLYTFGGGGSMSFATIGRPLCIPAQINALSGYILCDSSATVSAYALQEELDEINNHLRGGFYYE